jgi:hypothetical protein
VLEGLWLANPGERIPEDGLDQTQGAEGDFPIRFNPVPKVFSELWLENRRSLAPP